MADKWIQLQSSDGVDNLFSTSKPDLRYTNASPSSGMGGNVEIDLDCPREPKYLLVEVVQNVSSTNKYYEVFVVPISTLITHSTVRYDGSTNYMLTRSFSFNPTTSIFYTRSTGYYGTAWNSLSGTSIYFLVPTRVWAIY